jgi:small GTP-binding protein
MGAWASSGDGQPVRAYPAAGHGVPTMARKVCLLGDPAVGKSSLVLRMAGDRFNELYVTTVGARVLRKTVTVRPPGAFCDTRVDLMVWEVTGHIRPELLHLYLAGTNGAIVVGDATRLETQKSLFKWTKAARAAAGNVPVMMLLNKMDIPDSAIERELIEGLAAEHGCAHRLTSARTGRNVEAAFTEMAASLARPKGPAISGG